MTGHGDKSGGPAEAAVEPQRQEELRRRAIDLLRMTDELTVADLGDDAESSSGLRSLDAHLAVRSGELRDRLLAPTRRAASEASMG